MNGAHANQLYELSKCKVSFKYKNLIDFADAALLAIIEEQSNRLSKH